MSACSWSQYGSLLFSYVYVVFIVTVSRYIDALDSVICCVEFWNFARAFSMPSFLSMCNRRDLMLVVHLPL